MIIAVELTHESNSNHSPDVETTPKSDSDFFRCAARDPTKSVTHFGNDDTGLYEMSQKACEGGFLHTMAIVFLFKMPKIEDFHFRFIRFSIHFSF